MNKEFEFETYLNISPHEFEIFLFDKKKYQNFYEEKLKIINSNDYIDLDLLIKFLDENIFKIEKLIGKFVKNIILTIDCNKVLNLNFGIKKKNYQKTIDKNFLENLLTDAKNLFKESYQNDKIMHLIVKKYIIDDNEHFLFQKNFKGNNFCIEVEFISIPINYLFEINKVLEKYQIKIVEYYDTNYIKNLFKAEDIAFSEMVFRVQNGFIENEVKLIPKNLKKTGFFEKFFQLFS